MDSEGAVLGGAPTDATVTVGDPVKQSMSKGERLMVGFGCTLLGFMSLIPFQFVVVMLPVLSDHFLEGKQVGNSMLGLHQAACVLALLVILRIGALQKWMIQGALVLALACMAAFGPAFFYGSVVSRIVLVHIILGLLGCCNAMLQAAGFARAAILPRNYVGVTSIGQATAGLFVFIITSTLMNCVFDMAVKRDVVRFTGICCGVAVLLCVFAITYMVKFLKAKVCMHSVDDALHGGTSADQQQQQAEGATCAGGIEEGGGLQKLEQEEEALLPPRPWLTMVRGSCWELVSVFLVFFVSFNLFPKVGPLSFNFEGKAPARMIWLFGMQFVGDFVGRSCLKLPNVHSSFSFLFVSRRATIAASFLRLLFYIPFFLAARMENTSFVNHFAWLLTIQLLLAVTLGWNATLSLIYCSTSVTRASEKARMGSLATITLAVGIGVGFPPPPSLSFPFAPLPFRIER
ncbi:hypothetical protein Esti_000596 [Eimeria stiedai]